MRRLRRLLARQEGFTLAETTVTLAILGIVLAGLSNVFASGVKVEVEARQRVNAQIEARLALNQLRREVHCASLVTLSGSTQTRYTPAVTYRSVATLTLPGGCPTGSGTVTWCTLNLGTTRYGLYRSTSAPCDVNDRKVADYLTVATLFSYSAPPSGELGKLRVDFPVDLTPGSSQAAYRLEDDLVLRNTTRA